MTGRTRRARAAGGRSNQITVWLSDEEQSAVEGVAERAGMAAGAWLGEFGVRAAHADSSGGGAGSGNAALELMGLRSELMETRRVLTNVGGNLNDVARHANSTGALHAATAEVQALVARVVARVENTVDHVDAGMSVVLGRIVRPTRTGRRRSVPSGEPGSGQQSGELSADGQGESPAGGQQVGGHGHEPGGHPERPRRAQR